MSCGCGCSGEKVAYQEWGEEDVTAAEYQGRKVTLNKPFRTSGASKKFGVYTKNANGNVVIVRFGDPNMEIKRDDPARRKAFRSRHNCDNPGPKWKARYWSCRQWRGGKKVEAGMEDYIFSTPEGARQKSMEIGFNGEIHSDQMADGTPMYFPGPNEEEFQMWFDKNDSHDASASECNCGNVEAKDADDPCTEGYEQYGTKMKNGRKVPNCIPIAEAEEMKKKADTVEAALPKPMGDESHDEFMSRCMGDSKMNEEFSSEEQRYAVCMRQHEGHEFDEQAYYKKKEDEEASYHSSCGVGEKMVDGKCQKVAVTLDLDIDEIKAVLIAETGDTIIEISGIAFHEGMNKNKWSLTPEGAMSVVRQMKDSDLTLLHPKANETGAGFTRNTDGGLEEANVGYIVGASFFTTEKGYDVRYVAHVTRQEMFGSFDDGLWMQDGYGVSIGGSGVPVAADENGLIFGEDFTFDHLALVKKPAYERANVEKAIKKKMEEKLPIASEDSQTFIGHSMADDKQSKVIVMTEEDNTEINYEAKIEAIQAELVLANSRVAEFEAQVAAKAEEERISLVTKASELGMSGHDDLSTPTLETLIASWEAAHPEPTPVEMTPVVSMEKTIEDVKASEDTPKVENYLNGKIVANDEAIYAKAWNAWASAWNQTLAVDEKGRMKAHRYDTLKEMR
jgi:hypothetical protein